MQTKQDEILAAVSFYRGLAKPQRAGYPKALAESLGISREDFIAIVQEIAGDIDAETPANPLERFHVIRRNTERAFRDFSIQAKAVRMAIGPKVLTLGMLAPKVEFTKIHKHESNLAHALGVQNVRIYSPFVLKDSECIVLHREMRGAIFGVEIPSPKQRIITFDEIKIDSEFYLPLLLGLSVIGKPVVFGLEELPHFLIGGSSGSGKSVTLHSLICGLILFGRNVRFAMIDTKRLELTLYKRAPRMLAGDIANNFFDAERLLFQIEKEMQWRFDLFAASGFQNLLEFNESGGSGQLPFIVVIVDELADLIYQKKNHPISGLFLSLAQLGRAAGIHMIAATQQPSAEIINGLSKVNFSRMALHVPEAINSRIIIGQNGAERLFGRGDALLLPPDSSGLVRIHAPKITKSEIVDIAGGFDLPRYWLPKIQMAEFAEKLARARIKNKKRKK